MAAVPNIHSQGPQRHQAAMHRSRVPVHGWLLGTVRLDSLSLTPGTRDPSASRSDRLQVEKSHLTISRDTWSKCSLETSRMEGRRLVFDGETAVEVMSRQERKCCFVLMTRGCMSPAICCLPAASNTGTCTANIGYK